MAPIVVHVGLPKCASTLLQRHVFPGMSGVKYIAFADDEEAYRALAWRGFDGGESARATVLARLRRSAEKSSNSTLVSSEHFIMPGNWLQTMPQRSAPLLDGPQILSLIQQHLGDVRILLIVRKQSDWLESWYQERVKRYETRPLPEMLAAPEFQPILELLHYDMLIADLRERFGLSKVAVVPFELIKKSPDDFLRAIGRALGSTPLMKPLPVIKGGMFSGSVAARRLTNKLLVGLAGRTGGSTALDAAGFRFFKKIYAYDFLLKGMGGRSRREGLSAVQSGFDASNRKLETMLQIDLRPLGY